ncbi:MAG: ABC transporter ATP-binding protein [Deltaproteobacteria bacterium]|nr:ABC transporter ATP-binding protein [Deltaproteobacteria bacterium]
MIQVENLSKRFGDIRAVDGISFRVEKGEIYGLLGPNGAGKTTTMSMMTGLLEPDEGRVRFRSLDVAADPIAFRQQLGVVPQEIALYEDLTAQENLRFWGSLYGLGGKELKRAVQEVLEMVGLSGRSLEPVKRFSGGMKRRLNLSLGLVHKPQAVLLDEPTVGIDPQARVNILEVVRQVADAGTTVVYTTHYLEEAEGLCDRLGIMDHGQILAEGTLDELRAMVGEEETVSLYGTFSPEQAKLRMESIPGVHLIKVEPERLVLGTGESGRSAIDLLQKVSDLTVERISIQPPSLNGLFLKLTGRELRD